MRDLSLLGSNRLNLSFCGAALDRAEWRRSESLHRRGLDCPSGAAPPVTPIKKTGAQIHAVAHQQKRYEQASAAEQRQLPEDVSLRLRSGNSSCQSCDCGHLCPPLHSTVGLSRVSEVQRCGLF
jgi:hypothetical protein